MCLGEMPDGLRQTRSAQSGAAARRSAALGDMLDRRLSACSSSSSSIGGCGEEHDGRLDRHIADPAVPSSAPASPRTIPPSTEVAFDMAWLDDAQASGSARHEVTWAEYELYYLWTEPAVATMHGRRLAAVARAITRTIADGGTGKRPACGVSAGSGRRAVLCVWLSRGRPASAYKLLHVRGGVEHGVATRARREGAAPDVPLGERAWFAGNSRRARPIDAGTKQAGNPLGLVDMLGNVMEWHERARWGRRGRAGPCLQGRLVRGVRTEKLRLRPCATPLPLRVERARPPATAQSKWWLCDGPVHRLSRLLRGRRELPHRPGRAEEQRLAVPVEDGRLRIRGQYDRASVTRSSHCRPRPCRVSRRARRRSSAVVGR